MLVYRTTFIFEEFGHAERQLVEVATKMLAAFERICAAIVSSPARSFRDVPRADTENFMALLCEYVASFVAWRGADDAKLLPRIKSALVGMYQAERSVAPDEPEDSETRVEFRTQIARLRAELVRAGGEAELREFDRQMSGEAPASAAHFDEVQGKLTNDELAHEILLDPGFQLDSFGGCGDVNAGSRKVRESFHRAFWNTLADDLSMRVPRFARAVRVLTEIRDGFVDLGGGERALAVVPMDEIRAAASRGALDWGECVSLVSGAHDMVCRLQASSREGETAAMWPPVDAGMRLGGDLHQRMRSFCGGLEYLLDRVNAMRIDVANAKIRELAPSIRADGARVEREKFNLRLAEGAVTMDLVRDAVRATLEENSNLVGEVLRGNGAAFRDVHRLFLVRIVADPVLMTDSRCPAILHLDLRRLRNFQRDFQHAVTAASILICASHRRAGGPFLERLADLLLEERDCPKAVDAALEVSTFGDKNALRVALSVCSEPESAVRMLM